MHWENKNNKLSDLLYWDSHFTVAVWIPICSISEVNQCTIFLWLFFPLYIS